MDLPVEFRVDQNRFIASKFIRVSNKKINLLSFVPFQVREEDLHRVLRPELGQRFQAIESDYLQLKLLVNVKPGATILAARGNGFVLPSVVIMQATSATFPKYFISAQVDNLGKYLRSGLSPSEVCEQLYAANKSSSVLRLRVDSSEINCVRRLWPFLWTHWKLIILWTNAKERDHFHPPIRVVRYPFQLEISRLLEACKFDSTDDKNVIAMRSFLATVNLLFESVPGNRKLTLKKLIKNTKMDAKLSSPLILLSRVCGLSRLSHLGKSVRQEMGFIVNHVNQKLTFGEYLRQRTTAAFTFDENQVAFKSSLKAAVWKHLNEIEETGLIKLHCKKTRTEFVCMITPSLPTTLRSVLGTYFTEGELAMISSFQEMIQNGNGRQLVLDYLCQIIKKQQSGVKVEGSEIVLSNFFQHKITNINKAASETSEHANILSTSAANRSPSSVPEDGHAAEEIFSTNPNKVPLESGQVPKNDNLQAFAIDKEFCEKTGKPVTSPAECNKLTLGQQCKIGQKPKTNMPVSKLTCKSKPNCCDNKFGFDVRKFTEEALQLIQLKTRESTDLAYGVKCSQDTTSAVLKPPFAKSFQTPIKNAGGFSKRSADKVNTCAESGKQSKTETLDIYKCHKCPKTFSRKSNLKRHEFLHEKVVKKAKPNCEICGKKFERTEHLENHMRTHTHEKPFFCELCSKEFATEWRCKQHGKSCN